MSTAITERSGARCAHTDVDTGPPSVTVVGGGAAGLTAAWAAAEQGAQVTVLERTREAGKKILMSGGSRCNVLPAEVELERDFFTSGRPAELKAIFRRCSWEECHWWLSAEDQVGLRLSLEETTSKYYPASNSAREVRDRLVRGCLRRGVRFEYNASVEELRREGAGQWLCRLKDGRQHLADRLVWATGGKSFPAVGTDGTGHRLLSAGGHHIQPTYPALTPLTGPHPGGEPLAGVSLNVHLMCQAAGSDWDGGERGGTKGTGLKLQHGIRTGGHHLAVKHAARSGMVFTHRGYSGPSVLDLSHFAVQ
ncbi:hypothetical protein CYMTET_24721, partial [Cymbomonas tetramitiformis]